VARGEPDAHSHILERQKGLLHQTLLPDVAGIMTIKCTTVVSSEESNLDIRPGRNSTSSVRVGMRMGSSSEWQ
jgi:hypothetical protein